MELGAYLDLNSGILDLDADFRDMELRRALREHVRNTLKLEPCLGLIWEGRELKLWGLGLGCGLQGHGTWTWALRGLRLFRTWILALRLGRLRLRASTSFIFLGLSGL